MRTIILAAAATLALSGSAFASDAFVGQVGGNNQGTNIQLNQLSTSTSVATILQFNNLASNEDPHHGHHALQVQLDSNNSAYTYQNSVYHDFNALSWQQGGANNSAVTVQLSDGAEGGACGAGDCGPNPANSVILQQGASNVAVNWQQVATAANAATYTANEQNLLTAPSTSLNVPYPTYTPTSFSLTAYPNNVQPNSLTTSSPH